MNNGDKIFCRILKIVPTGLGTTARRLPGSMTYISTYPFIPPSTLSGFLMRLIFLKVKGMLPEQLFPRQAEVPTCWKEEEILGKNRKKRKFRKPNYLYFVLPKCIIALGAYPIYPVRVHTTRRHGLKNFGKPFVSSKIRWSSGAVEDFQLMDWEYLYAQEFVGYIASRKREVLEKPIWKELENMGCKLGKEGYAYVREIGDVLELDKDAKEAIPSTLIPIDGKGELLFSADEAFQMYRYIWDKNAPDFDIEDPKEAKIKGYSNIVVALITKEIELDFYTDGKQVFIPASFFEELEKCEI
jgi:hypothetical protein